MAGMVGDRQFDIVSVDTFIEQDFRPRVMWARNRKGTLYAEFTPTGQAFFSVYRSEKNGQHTDNGKNLAFTIGPDFGEEGLSKAIEWFNNL